MDLFTKRVEKVLPKETVDKIIQDRKMGMNWHDLFAKYRTGKPVVMRSVERYYPSQEVEEEVAVASDPEKKEAQQEELFASTAKLQCMIESKYRRGDKVVSTSIEGYVTDISLDHDGQDGYNFEYLVEASDKTRVWVDGNDLTLLEGVAE